MVAQAKSAATQQMPKLPVPEPVGVGKKLRDAYSWFEDSVQKIKAAAVEKRRKKERGNGPQLSGDDLVKIADELEEIQRQINPLVIKRTELVKKIVAHWGHSGIEEIEGKLGNTLISTSFKLVVEPQKLKEQVDE